MVPAAHASSVSSKVAYVFDFRFGVCDLGGPGLGSGIFANAITTAPSSCPIAGPAVYTTSGGHIVTLTNVPVSTVAGVATLAPFDTVMLYQVCDIGSKATLMTALNDYLTAGDGKVTILDGDRCSPAAAGTADYSTFLYPFTSNNPGPFGLCFGGVPIAPDCKLSFVESEPVPNTLTRNFATGQVITGTDAVGDSNTFVTFDSHWCGAITGTNGNPSDQFNKPGVTGFQLAYAHGPTSAGGLVIWNGWDQWFTDGPNAADTQVFDNMLDQPFNPDSLPCGRVASGITLTPSTATNPVGTSHTVTATVLDNTGAPISGITVTFTVTGGPNIGKTGTAVTDPSGKATFTYTDTGGAGTDSISAKFTDANEVVHTSNTANKIWGGEVGVPEFPGTSMIVVAIGLMAMAFMVKRFKRNLPVGNF